MIFNAEFFPLEKPHFSYDQPIPFGERVRFGPWSVETAAAPVVDPATGTNRLLAPPVTVWDVLTGAPSHEIPSACLFVPYTFSTSIARLSRCKRHAFRLTDPGSNVIVVDAGRISYAVPLVRGLDGAPAVRLGWTPRIPATLGLEYGVKGATPFVVCGVEDELEGGGAVGVDDDDGDDSSGGGGERGDEGAGEGGVGPGPGPAYRRGRAHPRLFRFSERARAVPVRFLKHRILRVFVLTVYVAGARVRRWPRWALQPGAQCVVVMITFTRLRHNNVDVMAAGGGDGSSGGGGSAAAAVVVAVG